MDNNFTLEEKVNKALQCEAEGNIKGAVRHFNEALEQYPAERLPILYEMAWFLFRTGAYADALGNMIECYNRGYQAGELLSAVMDAYYHPNVDEFARQYEDNLTLLKEYDKSSLELAPKFENLNYRFVPYSEEKHIAFHLKEKKFSTVLDASQQTIVIPDKPNQIYLIKNEYNISNLKALERASRQDNRDSFVSTQLPLYLVYEDKDLFFEYLQVMPFSQLLENRRTIFIFGMQEARRYFNKETAVFPTLYLNLTGAEGDPYFKVVEKAKSNLLSKGAVGYQNMMQLFKDAFKAN